MFQKHWVATALVIVGVVVVYMIVTNPTASFLLTPGSPTLKFKPAQGAVGGVVANVSDAVGNPLAKTDSVEDELDAEQWSPG